MSDDDQKIFIDEDWKARVQREKEEARKRLEAEAQAKAAAAVPRKARRLEWIMEVSFLCVRWRIAPAVGIVYSSLPAEGQGGGIIAGHTLVSARILLVMLRFR